MTDTAPLVPPEVDLRGLPFMPLDVVRLLDSDIFALSTGDEFKAALALWGRSWLQVPAASLPDDDRILARLSSAGAKWKRLKTVAMRGWVKCSDGRWYHPVIAEKALEAWRHRLAQRDRAAKRWQSPGIAGASPTASPTAYPTAYPTAEPRQSHGISHGNARESKGTVKGQGQGQISQKQKRPRAPETPMPPDFGISERVRTWAESKGFCDLDDHLEVFRSKATAKGYTYADWDEGFMGAIRDDWARLRSSNGGARPRNPNRQESLEERNLRVAEAWTPPEDS